jgi:hypothetical protein
MRGYGFSWKLSPHSSASCLSSQAAAFVLCSQRYIQNVTSNVFSWVSAGLPDIYAMFSRFFLPPHQRVFSRHILIRRRLRRGILRRWLRRERLFRGDMR